MQRRRKGIQSSKRSYRNRTHRNRSNRSNRSHRNRNRSNRTHRKRIICNRINRTKRRKGGNYTDATTAERELVPIMPKGVVVSMPGYVFSAKEYDEHMKYMDRQGSP